MVANADYQFPEAFNATLTHRRFLCYPTAARRTHHLHLVDEPEDLDRRLHFRDILRADPVLAAEYAALKHALAERHKDDREAYTEAKGAFVKHWNSPALEPVPYWTTARAQKTGQAHRGIMPQPPPSSPPPCCEAPPWLRTRSPYSRLTTNNVRSPEGPPAAGAVGVALNPNPPIGWIEGCEVG
ncbi:MAG: GrpB family protein [Solirubrobacteraceae bacterium]